MTLRLPTQGLLRDAAHLAIGQGARLLIQAAYFILLARALGPDKYGAFVTAVAMAAVLSPFSGLGTPNLFIKNVRSGKREAQVCWGNGLLLSLLSGLLLTGLATAIGAYLHLKIFISVIVFVAFSDLVLLKITELAAFGFTAMNQMKQTSLQIIIVSGLRLSGIVLLQALSRRVSLERWVMVYLCASLLGAAYAILKGTGCWGYPRIHVPALREDTIEGLFFSIAGSAATIYNDVDKIMLSRLSTLEATGVYAAAYRVIDVSMTPIRSLAAAAYPQFFEKGRNGHRATYRYALDLIARTSIYGLTASATLWFLAPALPHILGARYVSVAPTIRWLSLIPFLRCIHSFLADALSGAGSQRTRTIIQVVVAVANIALNLLVLPRYSSRGAAWSSLACDCLLVILFWSAALFWNRHDADRRPEGTWRRRRRL